MKEIGITSSSTQLGINGGMKSCSLVTNIGMSFLADKMGRRPMYLISVSNTYHNPHPTSTLIIPSFCRLSAHLLCSILQPSLLLATRLLLKVVLVPRLWPCCSSTDSSTTSSTLPLISNNQQSTKNIIGTVSWLLTPLKSCPTASEPKVRPRFCPLASPQYYSQGH
jgi:MFS family permease